MQNKLDIKDNNIYFCPIFLLSVGGSRNVTRLEGTLHKNIDQLKTKFLLSLNLPCIK